MACGSPNHLDAPATIVPSQPHLYCGLVGLYCGLVGEYCGLVGLHWATRGMTGGEARQGLTNTPSHHQAPAPL